MLSSNLGITGLKFQEGVEKGGHQCNIERRGILPNNLQEVNQIVRWRGGFNEQRILSMKCRNKMASLEFQRTLEIWHIGSQSSLIQPLLLEEREKYKQQFNYMYIARSSVIVFTGGSGRVGSLSCGGWKQLNSNL